MFGVWNGKKKCQEHGSSKLFSEDQNGRRFAHLKMIAQSSENRSWELVERHI